jgi:hypothetical protein
MRRNTAFLLLLILTAGTTHALAPPELIHIPNAGTQYPAWVAAEKVLTPFGEVDPLLFSPADRSTIKGYLRLPAHEGCIRLGQELEVEKTTAGIQKPARQTLNSMAKSAGWVFSATVTARAAGFNGSNPGTLLEITPNETLKGPQNRSGVHYVFIPVGTISVGGKKICKTDERYAALPNVGERIVLFVDLFWQNEGRLLWAGGDSGIITINRNGIVSLPRRYLKTNAELSGVDEASLLGYIRQSLER